MDKIAHLASLTAPPTAGCVSCCVSSCVSSSPTRVDSPVTDWERRGDVRCVWSIIVVSPKRDVRSPAPALRTDLARPGDVLPAGISIRLVAAANASSSSSISSPCSVSLPESSLREADRVDRAPFNFRFLFFLLLLTRTTSLKSANRRISSAATASRSVTSLDNRAFACAVARRINVSSVRAVSGEVCVHTQHGFPSPFYHHSPASDYSRGRHSAVPYTPQRYSPQRVW